MNKLLLFATTALLASSALAELPSDGYYRVQNAYTKRFAYLLDDKGTIDDATIDVRALQLYKESPELYSDPASVFYIQHATSNPNNYDIYAQGTSIHGFLNRYIQIVEVRTPYDGRDAYFLYGTDSGVAKYLGDIRSDMDDELGLASSEAKGDDRKWYFDAIDATSDMYFGVAPSLEADGKFYYPFFAGFPFSAYSDGLKFYTITDLDKRGGAIISEIKGTVPAGTPVIVECGSKEVSGNRLVIGGNADAGAGAGNLLKGVYFNNPSFNHNNQTPFDKESMRLLGIKDGKLAFVEGDIDFLPRNQAYLQLTDPDLYAVKDFLVITEEERETLPEIPDDPGDVVGIIAASSVVDVYSLDGSLVKAGLYKSDVNALGKGLYILRSGSSTEKCIVR